MTSLSMAIFVYQVLTVMMKQTWPDADLQVCVCVGGGVGVCVGV